MGTIKGSGILAKDSGTVNSFTDIQDVPQSYDGFKGQILAVNNDETGLEFIEITNPLQFKDSGTVNSFTDIQDVPQSYDGFKGQILAVNNDETGLEFIEITNPLQFKGGITINSDFPKLDDVKNGWTYTILEDVIDDDPTKTNTGLEVSKDNEITWNGTNWTVLGKKSVRTVNGMTGDVEVEEAIVNNTTPSVIAVGGIASGTTFENTTFSEFVDMLLYPELFGNLTNPSSTFTSSVTGLREVGDSVNINFNATFSRGSINPQYQSDSPFRSGLPNEYIYSGNGLTNQSKTDLSDAQSVTSYVISLGSQSWTGRVAYDSGTQPKGSKGSEFNSPLSAGMTSNITRTITGVYPYFATTSDITIMTKQSLATHGSQVDTSMVAESGSDKQSVEFPLIWGSIVTLQQYNTLSGQWDTIDLSTFTVTDIIKDINGNSIDYKKYIHNGSLTGARQLRWRTS